MSTQAIQTTNKTQAVTVRSLVSAPAMQQRFKEVLKDRAPQFISSLINISNSMKDVEPHSIIQSAMVAAALDLPIDRNLGFAWIVPFKKGGEKQAQFQMGFKGFIQLALRSGQYKRMNARAVNAEALNGFDDVGEPLIDWSKIDETKPTSGYVFAFQLVNGFTKCAYWSKQRVEEHAKRYSQSFRGGYDSPWKTHFDEMSLKTVIKNELPKWGIMSIEMQKAVETDQAVIDVDGNVEFLDNTPEVKRPQFDGPPQLPEPPVEVQTTKRKVATKPQEPVLEVVQPDDGDLGPEPVSEPVNNPVNEPSEDDTAAQKVALLSNKIKARAAALNLGEADCLTRVISICERRNLIIDGAAPNILNIRPEKYAPLTKSIASGALDKEILG